MPARQALRDMPRAVTEFGQRINGFLAAWLSALAS